MRCSAGEIATIRGIVYYVTQVEERITHVFRTCLESEEYIAVIYIN